MRPIRLLYAPGLAGPRALRRPVAALTLLALLMWPAAAMAHLDPPGPPAIDVQVDTNSLTLTSDQDDYGNAELLLAVNATHQTHGQATVEFENSDYDWDAGVPWLLSPTLVYLHTECQPRAAVSVGTALIELDTSKTSQVLGALGSAAAGAAAGSLVAGPPGIVAGAIAGLVVSLATSLNGNDNLGVASGIVPANGTVTLTSVGPDGGATIQISGTTTNTSKPGCAAAATPATPALPGTRTSQIYPPLKEAFALAAQVDYEQGNPAGLSAQQLGEIKQSLARTAVGMGEVIAAAEVESARNYEGYATAAEIFFAGRELAAQQPEAALDLFAQAFLEAAIAREEAVQAERLKLPLEIALSSDFISTRAGRRLTFLAVLVGAGEQSNLTLAGQPGGMFAAIERIAPESPVYRITMDVGSMEPGAYQMMLRSTDSGVTAERTLTVAVNPAPPAFQNGVEVKGETTGSTTAAYIDPSRDQALTGMDGAFRIKLPAGAVLTETAKLSGQVLMGADVAEVLGAARLPAGVRSLGWALRLAVTAPTSPVKRFMRQAHLSVRDGLEGAENPAHAALYRLMEDGTLAFVGGRLMGDSLAVRLDQPGTYLLAEVMPDFADLAGHWAAPEVALMAAKQIVRGTAPGRFEPAGTVTRAQFAALLVRAMGLQEITAMVEFADVYPTDWFYNEVRTAASAGLVNGMGDGSFAPNAPVTREQVAVMLARALLRSGRAQALTSEQVAQVLAPYADQQSISGWARADLALAIRYGLVRGLADGRLGPRAQASRAEAAVMMARFWR